MTSSRSDRSATRACCLALRGPALMGQLGSFTSPSSVSVPLEKGLSPPSRELLSHERLRLRCRRAAVPCRRSEPLMLLLSASLHEACCCTGRPGGRCCHGAMMLLVSAPLHEVYCDERSSIGHKQQCQKHQSHPVDAFGSSSVSVAVCRLRTHILSESLRG